MMQFAKLLILLSKRKENDKKVKKLIIFIPIFISNKSARNGNIEQKFVKKNRPNLFILSGWKNSTSPPPCQKRYKKAQLKSPKKFQFGTKRGVFVSVIC